MCHTAGLGIGQARIQRGHVGVQVGQQGKSHQILRCLLGSLLQCSHTAQVAHAERTSRIYGERNASDAAQLDVGDEPDHKAVAAPTG